MGEFSGLEWATKALLASDTLEGQNVRRPTEVTEPQSHYDRSVYAASCLPTVWAFTRPSLTAFLPPLI
ncbi:hypothetical protein BC835DRAFT_1380250 [Cytidiella melzeri]|nr:hypothetical protein BC835DRAFT_1380250 [Cytidiella melzeri]